MSPRTRIFVVALLLVGTLVPGIPLFVLGYVFGGGATAVETQ
ncbi:MULTISPECIES: hypothetical protein [Haloferax]|nr:MULTISPECIES: hypothetical protein [Haloferax]